MNCICGNEVVPSHGDLYKIALDKKGKERISTGSKIHLITVEKIGTIRKNKLELTISRKEYDSLWGEYHIIVIQDHKPGEKKAVINEMWCKNILKNEFDVPQKFGKNKRLAVDFIEEISDGNGRKYTKLREDIEKMCNPSLQKTPDKGDKKVGYVDPSRLNLQAFDGKRSQSTESLPKRDESKHQSASSSG